MNADERRQPEESPKPVHDVNGWCWC